MAAAEREGVQCSYGARLVDAEALPSGRIGVRLEDGSVIETDVLLGADGVHSRVRAIVSPQAPAPRETTMGNVGGFVPHGRVAEARLEPSTYRMMFGRRAFFGYVVHPSGDVWWFANPPAPYRECPDAVWLASLFERDAGPAAALVRATPHPLNLRSNTSFRASQSGAVAPSASSVTLHTRHPRRRDRERRSPSRTRSISLDACATFLRAQRSQSSSNAGGPASSEWSPRPHA
jgi:2-polyprenyl-6-methoxyphenol hydroxylase-like FAD-dependent oxidoreductase